MEEIIDLSPSKVSSYCRCPLQFKYSYIDKIKKPIRISMIAGKSGHATFEKNFKQKPETHEDLSENDLTEFFADNFDTAIKNRDSEIENDGNTPGDTKDKTVELIKMYKKDRLPNIMPVNADMVEKWFEITFDNAPYKMRGYIDLVTDKGIIMDYKFTGRRQSKEQLENNPQLLCYPLGYQALTGKLPKGFRFDFLKTTKKPELDYEEFKKIDDTKIHWFLRQVALISAAIKTGIFYPSANPINCSWCGYAGICRKGGF